MQITRTHLRVAVLLLFAAISFAGCGNRAAREEESAKKPAGRPTIVFMAEFGTANDAVAICRAVIVESKKEQYFVPDDGLITPVADRDGVEGVREITNPAWMIGDKVSSTFHGRDIFSPAAAHLAAGEDWTLAGPTVDTLVRLRPATATINAKGITGQVMGLDDPLGSLITEIQGDDFKKLGYSLGEKVPVKIEQKLYSFPYGKTFMDVPVGESLLYIDSRGRVGLAVNQGNFSRVYKITPPVSVLIARKKG